MTIVNKLMALITLIGYVATCLRLLTYRRGLSNYRFGMSLVAWSLISLTGCSALNLLFHPAHVTVSDTVLATTLFVLVWRARGNVAGMMRGTR